MLKIGTSTGGDDSCKGLDVVWTYTKGSEGFGLEKVVPVLIYTSIGGQRAWGSREPRNRMRVFKDEVKNHRLQLHGKIVESKHRDWKGGMLLQVIVDGMCRMWVRMVEMIIRGPNQREVTLSTKTSQIDEEMICGKNVRVSRTEGSGTSAGKKEYMIEQAGVL